MSVNENYIDDNELPKPATEKNILRGADLAGKPMQRVKMTSVSSIVAKDGTPLRIVHVDYQGREMQFILNKTNKAIIVGRFGKNLKDWINKEIGVAATKQNNPTTGQIVDSIQVIATA